MTGLDIKIRDLVKVHHTGKIEVQALRGLNLDITSGELVSIIGPSGSGKTTLLNIIGGLDKATAGTVQVGDKTSDIPFSHSTGRLQKKNSRPYLPKPKLNPTLTAQENVEFSMVASGAPRAKRKERVARIAWNRWLARPSRPQT